MGNINVQNVRSIYFDPTTKILHYSVQADPDDVTASVIIIDFDAVDPEFRLGLFTSLDICVHSATEESPNSIEQTCLFSLATNPEGSKIIPNLRSEQIHLAFPNSATVRGWAANWQFPAPIHIRPKTQQFQIEAPPAENNVADTGIYIVSWGIHLVE